MKKILFVIPSFEFGGTNSSLLNLISEFKDAEITVFPIAQTGEMKAKFKSTPQLTNEPILNLWYGNFNGFRWHQKIGVLIIKLVKRFFYKVGINIENTILRKYAEKKRFSGFDTVIGYQEGNATYLASHIPAKQHISWIHCNLKHSKIRFDDYKECYAKSDTIVCVSESGKLAFDEIYPSEANKSIVIYNLLNKADILRLSNERLCLPDNIAIDENEYVLLSVGRLNPIKQFDLIPSIAVKLKEKSLKFKWLIIGDGPEIERNKIQRQIDLFGVSDRVFMLGYKENPYPYFKRANLYVCTSESEACPMVFLEANTLNTFVISNDFPSAHELIEDGSGTICSISDMPNMILQYLDKKSKINIGHNTIMDNSFAKLNILFKAH